MTARSFPSDVVVLDRESLVHARLGRGKKNPQLVLAKNYRLDPETFRDGVVSPELVNESALAEVLRRLRMETGRWELVSILLPDSWFRINLLDIPSLPEKQQEADQVVRWSLKRTLPIAPEELRVVYQVISRTGEAAKVLVLSALEKTLAAIERVFTAAGFEVVLVEPVGLNLWNAITIREEATTKDRLFIFVRDSDFTTAVFRGSQPLFIRSRNLSGERTMRQEIRLSATYLRDTLQVGTFENCYLAGQVDEELQAALAYEFGSPVQAVGLSDFVEESTATPSGFDAELAACAGVFTS